MEIILLENVAKCGVKGGVVNVPPGYGQFLIKAGKARVATAKAKVAAEKISKEHAEAVAKYASDVEAAVEKFKGSNLTIKAKASDKGHLFEGIGKDKIAEALSTELGIKIAENALELKQPIKEVGEHSVGITTDAWEGSVTVLVEAEE